MFTFLSFLFSFFLFILLFALIVGLFTFLRMGMLVRGMGRRMRQHSSYNRQETSRTKAGPADKKKVIAENIIKESAGEYVDYEEVPDDTSSRQ